MLVCGGSTGIGHSIARNFCIAGASSVIILARRPDVLEASVEKLAEAHPKTHVVGRPCNVFNVDEINKAWDWLESSGVKIDVLAWVAVGAPAMQPVLEQGAARLWEDFENNVRAPLFCVERFYKQPGHDTQKVCWTLQWL